MDKRTTPAGETIFICSDEQFFTKHGNIKLFVGSTPWAILRTLFNAGPVFHKTGFATGVLLDKVQAHTHMECNTLAVSNALNKLNSLDLIKRDVRGRRTYSISMKNAVLPRLWYERLVESTGTETQTETPVEETEVGVPLEPAVTADPVMPTIQIVDTVDRGMLATALAEISDGLDKVRLAFGIEVVVRDHGDLVNQNRRLIEENARLNQHLNDLSRQLRGTVSDMIGRPVPVIEHDAGNLNLRSLGVKDSKMKLLFRHAHANGFRIEKTGGGHIKLTPPDKTKNPIHTSSTPSDYRVYNNLYSQLVNAGMPKMPNK